MIDYRKDADGVAHIVWNNPDGPVNIKSPPAIAAFSETMRAALADAEVKAVLVRSAKRDFVAGGDLETLYATSSPLEAIEQVRGVGDCLRFMETQGKPVVAVLEGSALGGGLELALACHHRVVVDDARIKLGLPEVTLGLIPGAGGTQRLPRLIGIGPASKMLLEGKPVGAREALAMGLVDELVPSGEAVQRAKDWALAHPQVQQPWDRTGFEYPDFHPQSREGRWFFFGAWPRLRRKSPPDDLAPGALLQVLAQGLERGIDAGLAIERRQFGIVAASPSAKNRIRTSFFAANAARKQRRRPAGEPTFEPTRVGVVGVGLMGSGIATVCALAGLQTVLLDADASLANKGRDRVARALDAAVERKRLSPAARDEALACVQASADYAAFAGCQVVIEAVVESADVKQAVFAKVVEAAGPDVLLASNTSTLSISSLAEGLVAPQNFIGLHFFAPVDRMALVEVILGQATSPATHARALDLLQRLRKTAVVVRDGPGFFTSRVVGAYTREALTMLAEGIEPARIDNAAFMAGLPMGPLAMADLTSYDLLVDIIGSLARTARGTAVESDKALDAARRLVAAGRLGRKGQGGVYDYGDTGKRVWPGVSELFPRLAEQPPVSEVVQRLMHIQSLETVHAMQEEIVEDPLEVDLGSVLGWSYPAFRGGVLAHVDDAGLPEFVRQCEGLALRHGRRFDPPALLKDMASSGRTFHARAGART